MGAAIAKLPPGEASAEGLLDSDGVTVDQPIRLAVKQGDTFTPLEIK